MGNESMTNHLQLRSRWISMLGAGTQQHVQKHVHTILHPELVRPAVWWHTWNIMGAPNTCCFPSFPSKPAWFCMYRYFEPSPAEELFV